MTYSNSASNRLRSARISSAPGPNSQPAFCPLAEAGSRTSPSGPSTATSAARHSPRNTCSYAVFYATSKEQRAISQTKIGVYQKAWIAPCAPVPLLRLTAIQLLPTPPFPLVTAIVFPIMLPAFRAHVLRSARQSCSYRRPLYRLEPVPPPSYMKGITRSV